jgi:hypothetical protein
MKPSNSFVRLFSLALIVGAATIASGDATADSYSVCSLGTGGTGGYSAGLDAPPEAWAAKLSTKVYNSLCPGGCGAIGLVQNETAGNAITFSSSSPYVPSKVAYSPSFFSDVKATYGEAAVFGILAHELGHHVDAHVSAPVWFDTSWQKELRADAYAGCALAKAKLSTAQLENVAKVISKYASPTHPAWPDRIDAIEHGFHACGGTAALPSNLKPSAAKSTTALTANENDDDLPTMPQPKPKTKVVKDPCGCKNAFTTCLNDILTEDECLGEQIAKCITVCSKSYPESTCTAYLCSLDQNETKWTARCAKEAKTATASCAAEKAECVASCDD